MLIQAALGLLGPMLLELAVKEVAVPAAKRLVGGAGSGANAAGSDVDGASGPRPAANHRAADLPLLAPVRSVQVVSETPGRVRLEVVGLKDRPELVAG